jgi:spore coat protein CotH
VKKLLLAIAISAAALQAQIPEFRITMDREDLDSLLSRDAFSNKALSAKLEYAGEVWKNIGVRFKGRSNRYFPKHSYRLKLSGRSLNGARQINLHSMYTDKSFLREKLAWDVFADIGEMAPRASYAKLTLNGKSQGLYLDVERVDKYFLQNRGRQPGSLYNAGGYYSLADMSLQSKDLLKLYYPKEIGDEDDYRDLQDLFRTIRDTPDSSFADVMNRTFDMKSVFGWLEGNILLAMGDSYNKNYYLYHDASRPAQQWTIIPWDYDESFGLSGDLAIPYPASLLNDGFEYRFPALAGPSNVLKDRIWANPGLRSKLVARVDSLLRTVFTEERMAPRIDSLASLIRADAEADTAKWGTTQDFLDNVETVKYFVTARRNYLFATLIDSPRGMYDIVTMRTTRTGVPYRFTGFDGSLVATLWLTSFRGLDSIQVESFPDSLPPDLRRADSGRCVKRWLRITPFPARAKFTARVQWMYHDASSADREVGHAVKDERALGCFLREAHRWVPLPAKINPFANLVTIDSITDRQCGPERYLALYLP